ncbi:gibberellin 2-beta-dioxygenase-like [Solanum dulcamara]|uniref:gibberellin 2-beta-dioxygenase-like n=1 Tax=Solanum dulcamara TaxID=45834 RepID=UPI0024860492|nr:gibberellin 2-beta-dioxygenase-like [Solanum dulcamara]
MVVTSHESILPNSSYIFMTYNNNNDDDIIPVIDMLDPQAKFLITKACQEFGFFKIINHGVPDETMIKLENDAINFFNLPQCDKDKAAPASPFGYGNKRIGSNGDVGWAEYLLFAINNGLVSEKSVNIPQNSQLSWYALNEYVTAVRNIACVVLEKIEEGLRIEPKNVLSRLLRDEKSDSCFRINHYAPCTEIEAYLNGGRNFIGFGEHTDPQVISVIRSNNTTGLQISLRDGTWVSVPPDEHSFFIIVGDSLQVMTNGRFRSVKHRVLANSIKSRLSMIYFGGPPLNEKIVPLSSLMEEEEESLYKEFTWLEYKKYTYMTRLGADRLELYEKNIKVPYDQKLPNLGKIML